jgi:HNH endonuclease
VVPTTVLSQLDASLAADPQAALDEIVGAFQRWLREARPGSISGERAMALVEGLSQLQRMASSGIALYAPVVVETGSFAKAGHSSAPDWLGSISGSSTGAAKGLLSAAGRAASSPELTEALHGGDLSTDQLKLVTKTTGEVNGAAGELLELIKEGVSHKELTDTSEQMRSAARSREAERVRRERIHDTRHLRWHQDENGGIRFSGFCDEVAWSYVAPQLEADAKARWKAAGADGDPLEAYRLDAFIDLMGGGPLPGPDGDPDDSADFSDAPDRPSRSARPHSVVIINAESLRRGSTQGDEICEIDGIGPVSVAAATELLGTGGFQFLVKEGFDIKTMTRTNRYVDKYIDTALLVRDRVCARPGCGNRLGLERDHWRIDYKDDGPTELNNLVRLCPACHDLKTYGGWKLTGGPGHWGWVAPKNPPSAGYIARKRKLAATQAQAGVIGDRNSPRKNPRNTPRRT